MAQHLNIKFILAAGTLAALFYLGASAPYPAQAKNSSPSPQTYPVISLNTPLARDADTFEGDRALEAACRKSGQDKAICLCVTHILKYELTLPEYRAATRLYGQPSGRVELHKTLKDEGFAAAEISMAEELERSLTRDDDFALRCAEAKAYYKGSAQ